MLLTDRPGPGAGHRPANRTRPVSPREGPLQQDLRIDVKVGYDVADVGEDRLLDHLEDEFLRLPIN